MRIGALIFGQRMDWQVKEVSERLEKRGVEVLIFDHYFDQCAVTFDRVGDGGKWPFVDWLNQFDGAAIWSRVKAPISKVRDELMNPYDGEDAPLGPYETRLFFHGEWRVFHQSLMRILRDQAQNAKLLNAGEFTREANCKPLQLAIASDVGFNIPRTVVGNSESAIDAMFSDTVLYKPSSGLPAAGRGIPPPALLSKRDILELGRASVAPSIFQDEVVKDFELRVTVAGGKLSVVRLDSQAINHGRLDWRLASRERELYSIGTVSKQIADKMLAYMSAFELDYGAFDFAVTKEGDTIFFECNPAGQFGWLTEMVDLDITETVVDMIHDAALAKATAKSAPALVPA